MPKRQRLSTARGQTLLCNRLCGKSQAHENVIPLQRKSTSVLSVKASTQQLPRALRRKDLKSLTYLTSANNEPNKAVTLKSCISSQKQNDKIKMKVKFYIKKTDNNQSYSASATKSDHDFDKSITKRQKETPKLHSAYATLHSNKIDFNRARDMAGDNNRLKINIKPKKSFETTGKKSIMNTLFLKKTIASKIKNIIIDKSKQFSDTSLKHRRNSLKLRFCNSYSSIVDYDKFEQNVKTNIKKQIVSPNSKTITKQNKVSSDRSKPLSRSETTRKTNAKSKGTISTIFKNINQTSQLHLRKSLPTPKPEHRNSGITKSALSAVLYHDICGTGKRREERKYHENYKKRRSLSIRFGKQTSKQGLKYFTELQNANTAINTPETTQESEDLNINKILSNKKLKRDRGLKRLFERTRSYKTNNRVKTEKIKRVANNATLSSFELSNNGMNFMESQNSVLGVSSGKITNCQPNNSLSTLKKSASKDNTCNKELSSEDLNELSKNVKQNKLLTNKTIEKEFSNSSNLRVANKTSKLSTRMSTLNKCYDKCKSINLLFRRHPEYTLQKKNKQTQIKKSSSRTKDNPFLNNFFKPLHTLKSRPSDITVEESIKPANDTIKLRHEKSQNSPLPIIKETQSIISRKISQNDAICDGTCKCPLMKNSQNEILKRPGNCCMVELYKINSNNQLNAKHSMNVSDRNIYNLKDMTNYKETYLKLNRREKKLLKERVSFNTNLPKDLKENVKTTEQINTSQEKIDQNCKSETVKTTSINKAIEELSNKNNTSLTNKESRNFFQHHIYQGLLISRKCRQWYLAKMRAVNEVENIRRGRKSEIVNQFEFDTTDEPRPGLSLKVNPQPMHKECVPSFIEKSKQLPTIKPSPFPSRCKLDVDLDYSDYKPGVSLYNKKQRKPSSGCDKRRDICQGCKRPLSECVCEKDKSQTDNKINSPSNNKLKKDAERKVSPDIKIDTKRKVGPDIKKDRKRKVYSDIKIDPKRKVSSDTIDPKRKVSSDIIDPKRKVGPDIKKDRKRKDGRDIKMDPKSKVSSDTIDPKRKVSSNTIDPKRKVSSVIKKDPKHKAGLDIKRRLLDPCFDKRPEDKQKQEKKKTTKAQKPKASEKIKKKEKKVATKNKDECKDKKQDTNPKPKKKFCLKKIFEKKKPTCDPDCKHLSKLDSKPKPSKHSLLKNDVNKQQKMDKDKDPKQNFSKNDVNKQQSMDKDKDPKQNFSKNDVNKQQKRDKGKDSKLSFPKNDLNKQQIKDKGKDPKQNFSKNDVNKQQIRDKRNFSKNDFNKQYIRDICKDPTSISGILQRGGILNIDLDSDSNSGTDSGSNYNSNTSSSSGSSSNSFGKRPNKRRLSNPNFRDRDKNYVQPKPINLQPNKDRYQTSNKNKSPNYSPASKRNKRFSKSSKSFSSVETFHKRPKDCDPNDIYNLSTTRKTSNNSLASGDKTQVIYPKPKKTLPMYVHHLKKESNNVTDRKSSSSVQNKLKSPNKKDRKSISPESIKLTPRRRHSIKHVASNTKQNISSKSNQTFSDKSKNPPSGVNFFTNTVKSCKCYLKRKFIRQRNSKSNYRCLCCICNKKFSKCDCLKKLQKFQDLNESDTVHVANKIQSIYKNTPFQNKSQNSLESISNPSKSYGIKLDKKEHNEENVKCLICKGFLRKCDCLLKKQDKAKSLTSDQFIDKNKKESKECNKAYSEGLFISNKNKKGSYFQRFRRKPSENIKHILTQEFERRMQKNNQIQQLNSEITNKKSGSKRFFDIGHRKKYDVLNTDIRNYIELLAHRIESDLLSSIRQKNNRQNLKSRKSLHTQYSNESKQTIPGESDTSISKHTYSTLQKARRGNIYKIINDHLCFLVQTIETSCLDRLQNNEKKNIRNENTHLSGPNRNLNANKLQCGVANEALKAKSPPKTESCCCKTNINNQKKTLDQPKNITSQGMKTKPGFSNEAVSGKKDECETFLENLMKRGLSICKAKKNNGSTIKLHVRRKSLSYRRLSKLHLPTTKQLPQSNYKIKDVATSCSRTRVKTDKTSTHDDPCFPRPFCSSKSKASDISQTKCISPKKCQEDAKQLKNEGHQVSPNEFKKKSRGIRFTFRPRPCGKHKTAVPCDLSCDKISLRVDSKHWWLDKSRKKHKGIHLQSRRKKKKKTTKKMKRKKLKRKKPSKFKKFMKKQANKQSKRLQKRLEKRLKREMKKKTKKINCKGISKKLRKFILKLDVPCDLTKYALRERPFPLERKPTLFAALKQAIGFVLVGLAAATWLPIFILFTILRCLFCW
ncbi:uncharacterized protein LOC118261901 [Spodoptera frugiperda]|uniref:Uncharacterized protein LOC118261901 n=1 Tax=Spodoptera frugiperda TaxID=7108 RepID=A0A9R0CTI9_SPOFR|nr:uncharacterized protein LOC118261901 [Spodoptera frugiperda]